MAQQITTALTMSLEERRDRWLSMVRKLKAGSVQNWFSDFLHTLSDVQRAPVRTATAPIVLDSPDGADRHSPRWLITVAKIILLGFVGEDEVLSSHRNDFTLAYKFLKKC